MNIQKGFFFNFEYSNIAYQYNVNFLKLNMNCRNGSDNLLQICSTHKKSMTPSGGSSRQHDSNAKIGLDFRPPPPSHLINVVLLCYIRRMRSA